MENIESYESTIDIPKELESLKDQPYFLNTFKKLKTWYGDNFNVNEIKIIKGIWTNSYNEYQKKIDTTRSIIIANRIDKGIFEYRYPNFVDIDKNIIRQIPDANKQRRYREVAISIEKEFHELSTDEVSIIEKEFRYAKSKGTLPKINTIRNKIITNRLSNNSTTIDEPQAPSQNPPQKPKKTPSENPSQRHPENPLPKPAKRPIPTNKPDHGGNDNGNNNGNNAILDKIFKDFGIERGNNDGKINGNNNGENNGNSNSNNNILDKVFRDLGVEGGDNNPKKKKNWPSAQEMQEMNNKQISPYFQNIERQLFESSSYNWDEYGNEEYVKYIFKKSSLSLDKYVDNIENLDDNVFDVIARELQETAVTGESNHQKITNTILQEIVTTDNSNSVLKKALGDINEDIDALIDDVNDSTDEEILEQLYDEEFLEELRYLEENGISGEWYKKARIAQKKYTEKLKRGEKLTETERELLEKLNIILGEDGNLIKEMIRLRKIKQIQTDNESKNFDGKFNQSHFEQAEGNIKSLDPDTIVHNNQNIHDYVFRESTDSYISFDGKIDAEYRKNLYQKLIKIHEGDIAFAESIKYLDEYGNIDYKKAQAENIDEDSLRQNFKTIDEMINNLAKKEYQDKDKIKRINDICTRKCIMTTCFRALSSYFDTTNFADTFEIGDINKDINFNEETGIIEMKGKIGGDNTIGLYYDTKKGELSFDNFIGYNSNLGYVIGTNNGEKEKINIKLPTMEDMERQSQKVDKDLIYRLSINTPFYIKTLTKCINESLWLGCFQGFIGTEMDVNKQFVKEFYEKNILKQEIFKSIYTKYYDQDSIDKIINDKLVISEGNEKQQFKLIKLISDSIDNCKNSNELLRFRNLVTEFDRLISLESTYLKKDLLLNTLFANNLNDDHDIFDQSTTIMKNENPNIVTKKNQSGIYEEIGQHPTNQSLNYYIFLDLLAEDQGIDRIINLDVFYNVLNTIKTDGTQLLGKKEGILWTNYVLKVAEGDLAEIVPISNDDTPENNIVNDNNEAEQELEERLNDIPD